MALPKTPSYYQDDTDGKYKGIEYFNLIILMLGAFISTIFTVIVWALGGSFFDTIWFTALPLVFCGAWVGFLRHNKPKSYDIDWLNSLTFRGWENRWDKSPEHPLEVDL